eukprot:TRINITY_DN8949_c4_g1_i1.p1 TRINITY_DN8949_c4_g1~~TRINITY_DN8949_c4_g1_i1.p1  ORF type:complete len:327 (+),score=110.91 TRINITY_DN8949_c4_g1_i1:61-1041(+)
MSETADEATPMQFVADLPDGVRENVLALQSLQSKYQEAFIAYLKEKEAIELKYEKLYQPLYAKRKEIVTGAREPTEEEVSKGQAAIDKEMKDEDGGVEELDDDGNPIEKAAEEEGADEQEDAEKGIPEFWLRALEGGEGITIEQHDNEILAHLTNITSETLTEPSTGFKLTFEFEENDFFTETTLTKTYYTKLDEEDGEHLLVKAEGCDISWAKGKNPTVTLKKKKQTSKVGKGTRIVEKPVQRNSFFKFFSPLQCEDSNITQTIADEMAEDHAAGSFIRERIIPCAVTYFTGQAMSDEGFNFGAEGLQEMLKGGADGSPQDCKQQ